MTDPSIVSIELIGNTDKLDRKAKQSADSFERSMDKIESSATKAEKSIQNFGKSAEASIPSDGGGAAAGLKKVGEEARKAEGDFKQYEDRLKRVAEAARKAFARIPQVRLARQLDPSSFEPARDEFVNRIVDQEKVNISEGVEESTQALDSLFASSGKTGAGLARFAGFAGAAAAGLVILVQGAVEAVAAFREADRDLDKFRATLALSGNQSQTTNDQLREIADTVSDVTLQIESSTRSAAAELATVPRLSAEALEEALDVSARLADTLETDVADVVSGTVAPALQALATEDIAALDDALIDLDPVLANTIVQLAEAGQTAEAQKALFAGLRDAAGDGPDGLALAADQLSERWQAAKEELGEDIASVTVPILESIVDVVDVAQEQADKLRISWNDLALVLASPITGTINIVRRLFNEEPSSAAPTAGAGGFTSSPFQAAFEREQANRARRVSEQQSRAEEQRQARIAARNESGGRGGRGGGARGRQGPTAEELAEREAQRARRAAAEQERLDQQILRTRERLASTEEEKLALARTAIDLQRQLDREDVDRRVAAQELTEAEANAIRERIDAQAELSRQILLRGEDERQARLALDRFRQQERQRQLDEGVGSASREQQAIILQNAAALARTQGERRELELQLLDLQFQEERIRNDAIIGEFERARIRQDITNAELAELEAAAAIAALRNQQLDTLRGQATEGILVSTAGPLEGFFRDLPQGARELNEALEAVAAGGLANVVDGLTDALVNFESLEDVALATLRSITQQLVRLALQAIIVKALGVPGFSGGGGIGGGGGSGIPGLRGGGEVRGPGTSTSDSILAVGPDGPLRLSDGEYVLRAAAVDAIGVSTLDAINSSRRLPGLRDGGSVRAVASGGAGMNRSDMDRLAQIVAQAAATQPEVNLFPTLDPGQALRASLGTRGGQQAFFDFIQANSGRVGAAINR